MRERVSAATPVGIGLLLVGTLLFLASAALAAQVAHAPESAWLRFGLLASGALLFLLAGLLVRWEKQYTLAGVAALACAVAAAALSVYFALDHDWTARPADFAPVQAWALQLQAVRPAITLPEDVNPNIAGSGLALLIPLGLGGLLWLPTRRPRWLTWPLAGLTVVLLLVACAGLVLTTSRGAWLGLVAGLVVWVYAAWRSVPGRARSVGFVADVVVWLVILGVVAGMLLVLTRPEIAGQLLGRQGGARAQLWQDGLALVADYRFTGSGLGTTMMVYSTYYFLLHVGFIGHMHNLLLQVAVEQGVPGLIGLVTLLAGAALLAVDTIRHGGTGERRLALAALAAMTTLLVQGLVDTGVYAGLVSPLLFVPVALAWAIRRSGPANMAGAWIGVALPLAALLVFLGWPGSRAALQANLGAVAQTQAELSVYTWPAWPIQDALRRDPVAVDLAAAEARYQAALRLQTDQATAQARLGQLALSRGDYATARTHLEAAYRVAPERTAVRQLLGEVYAVSGEQEAATALWRTVPNVNGQLEARRWWIQQTATPEQAARFAAALPR